MKADLCHHYEQSCHKVYFTRVFVGCMCIGLDKSGYLSYFSTKHMLWVLIRSASGRHF